MNWETLIISVELWLYLPVQTLSRFLQSNRRFYNILQERSTWEILLYRDFGRKSKELIVWLEYKKILSIVKKFSNGKTLTTDALNMLLDFYPVEFHKRLFGTYTFYEKDVITPDVLIQATREIKQDDCSDYDPYFDQPFFYPHNVREFLDKLKTLKVEKLKSIEKKMNAPISKKYMLCRKIPHNRVPMYVNGEMWLTYNVELIFCLQNDT